MRKWSLLAVCGFVITAGAHFGAAGAAAAGAPDRDDRPVPVRGQSSANGAPLLSAEPGWYRSKAPAADEKLHYQVRRRTPGSDLTAGIISRPDEPMDARYLRVELSTVSGTTCDADATWEPVGTGPRKLMDASVSDAAGGSNKKAAKQCARADRFVLTVSQTWDGNDGLSDARMDIAVHEEPEIANEQQLPKSGSPPAWTPPSSTERSTVTGAPHPLRTQPLEAGSYKTTISPGEQLFFRVDLSWGQALQAHVRVPRPPKDARGPIHNGDDQLLGGQLLSPTFGNPRVRGDGVDNDLNTATLSASDSRELQVFTNRVRYRGRDLKDSSHTRKSSAAGPYYLVLTLSDSEQDYELPVELEIATRGAVEPAPEYVDGAEPVGPVLGAEPPSEDATAVWLLGGGSVLLLVGTGTLIAARSSKRPARINEATAPNH